MRRRYFTAALLIAVVTAIATPALAAPSSVGLGTATSFAVLAGTTVTNTGPSEISGDLGVSPGTAITGFPPGQVSNGVQHSADAVALQAQSDLTTAYNDAAGRTPATPVTSDLGGQTLVAGVYQSASSMGLTGTVTLDGQDDPNSVFIFQAGSTLITASNSTVALINGAQVCNVFWQVGSSATLGTNTTFVGTIMALTSITVQTGTIIDGRALARNGQVSLDDNKITRPTTCIESTATATGTVFTDVDGDGVQDASEPSLAGQVIHLFGTTDDGVIVHLHTTTDSTGAYSFSAPPGDYVVSSDAQHSTGLPVILEPDQVQVVNLAKIVTIYGDDPGNFDFDSPFDNAGDSNPAGDSNELATDEQSFPPTAMPTAPTVLPSGATLPVPTASLTELPRTGGLAALLAGLGVGLSALGIALRRFVK